MKLFAVAAAVVAAAANLPSALGWWDNGHMLIGQVATQLMDPTDVATINSVLAAWNNDFPNTDTITTTAIWPDLLKCKSRTATCQTDKLPSFSMFDNWHYINLPANVDGSKWKGQEPGLQLFADNFDGLSIDLMEKVMATFNTTQSNWVANLAIRQFIHVFGDSHQPLHAIGGVSPGLPKGDTGGNAYKFASPCAFANLHAMWDAAAGDYSQNSWSQDTSKVLVGLKANATELISWLPALADPLNYEQYKDLSFEAFSNVMVSKSALRYMILDTNSYASNVVYSGLDLTFNAKGFVPCPPQSYFDWVSNVAKFRIAVAGKRLSVILTQFAKQLRTLKLAA